MKGIYLITGTSRGIGQAVAARLLATGNRVVGISRTPSPLDGKPGYRQVLGSLADTDWIETMLEGVKEDLDDDRIELLCLFHNAALVEPACAIEACTADDIRQHVAVNLTAPMLLTARFMAFFGGLELRKKVAFMTSGAAQMAFPDMALYCSTKAALSMFSQCLGQEQADQSHGFEIAAINPGMVESDMQKIARAKDPARFRPSEMFRGAKASGVVQDPETAARAICELLQARTEMGKTVSVTK
jgi:benzil reductase ((S)-benzoin forming)